MAETRTIRIEIVAETQKEPTEKKEKKDDTLNKLLHPIKTLEKATVGKNVFINQAYQQAKQLISQTLSTSINRYFELSEDYMTENSYKNTMTMLGKAKSAATSIIGGAMVGGVVGGIVAAIGWAGSEYIQNQAALSSYYSSINSTNMQTDFSIMRSGNSALINMGRGTDN